MKNLTLILLCTLSFFSCHQATEQTADNRYTAKEAEYDEMPQTARVDETSEEITNAEIERKLIKNAFLQYETKDLAKTHADINDAVKKWNGYLANDEEQKYYNRYANVLEIRLPAAHFDEFLAEITKGIARFDEKSINVTDVTEQFVDLEARLKTKKELEKRYLALLAKANTVTEILEIEREIAQLRGDIEAMEGRFKLLKNQISFSTIRVEFYVTTVEVYEEDSLGQKIATNFIRGWNGIIDFFVGLVRVWPFVIILLVLAYFIKKRFSKNKSK